MASLRDRFFVEGVHARGERVVFAADDARKIVTVLRGKNGESVHVVDSAGAAYSATIEIDGHAVHATLDERLERASRESAAHVTIAQAIPKGSKMDLIVEKATELGAFAVVPLRSQRVLGDATGAHKIDRWRRIAKTAAQQCGRTTVPTVADVASWDDLIATFGSYDRVYLPWELTDPLPLRDALGADAETIASALFIVGPEGGFTSGEVARAVEAGARTISLGTRILRTETVALVVLAAFAYARGDL